MKFYPIIVSLAFFISCSENSSTSENTTHEYSDTNFIEMPADYRASDGNFSLEFHDNGMLEKLMVVSDVYEVQNETYPEDSTGMISYMFYEEQIIYFNSEKQLEVARLCFDLNNSFTFYLDSAGNPQIEISSKFDIPITRATDW